MKNKAYINLKRDIHQIFNPYLHSKDLKPFFGASKSRVRVTFIGTKCTQLYTFCAFERTRKSEHNETLNSKKGLPQILTMDEEGS